MNRGDGMAADGMRSLLRHPSTWMAGLLLVAQSLWRGWHLNRGFFTQDDFLVLKLAAQEPLGSLLLQDYAGHILPARWVLAAALARLAPLSWDVAVLMTLLGQAIAGVLMWVVLTRILGDRWRRLPVFSFFLFSPLSLWPTHQWIVSLQFLPILILSLIAVWSLLRRLQEGWQWGVPLAWAAAVLALGFQERAILMPLLLSGVALMSSEVTGFRARIWATLRELWALWLGLGATVLGYLLLHAVVAPIDPTVPARTDDDAVALLGNFIFRTILPGLWGGPWQAQISWEEVYTPSSWSVILALILTVVFIVVTLRRGGVRAQWAWLVIGLYALADVLLLFGGRTQYGALIGLVPRYVSDLVPVVAIALAFMLKDVSPVSGRRTDGLANRLERRPGVLATACAALILVSSIPATQTVARHLEHADDRAYVMNLRADLRAHPNAVLYDKAPPDGVMVSWFGQQARVSTVLALAPEKPIYDVPSENMMIPDHAGRLHAVAIRGGVHAEASDMPDCGYPVSSGRRAIPMESPIAEGRPLAMRLSYYTNIEDVLTIAAGRNSFKVSVRPGLHEVSLKVVGGFDSVGASLEDGAGTVCIADVVVGVPEPRDPATTNASPSGS